MKRTQLLSLFITLLYLAALLAVPATALAYPPTATPSIQSDDQIHYININTDSTSDCILIESNGETMLVDTTNPDLSTGGPQAVANDTANVNEAILYLHAMGIEALDYVVLTHNHSDHIGGITRLCEEGLISENTTVYYRIQAQTEEDRIYPDWDNWGYLQKGLGAMAAVGANLVCLSDEGITTLTLALGDFSIDFLNLDHDKDGTVDFYYDNENNNSIVLRVTKGSVVTLLTGDIETEAETALLGQLGKVDVLKVPHHGNRTSSSYDFLREIQPETAILTANGYWQYGAYEYLSSIGTSFYATGDCPGLAIVEVVGEDTYELLDAVPYSLTAEEGWHGWLEDYYYVQQGEVLRNCWGMISGDWYYFNEGGLMLTGSQIIDGTPYEFREDGTLIGTPLS